jgi:hypothetical protein
MSGSAKQIVKNQEKTLKIINERYKIISVDTKERINPNFLNDVVRFSPIFMNVDIKTNKETIGEIM